jgi:glycosyltransferase
MKVSVITATFNNENTICDTVQSVVSQTYPDIEHIIVDGLSTDNTLQKIKRIPNRISNIISEKDNGIYDALNKGISVATGDLICFLHADDIFADSFVINNVVKSIKDAQVDALYADLQYVSRSNTDSVIRFWKAGCFSIKKMKRGWMPPHPTLFIKKTIYEKYGFFNTEFKISADYDLILRFFGINRISSTYLPQVIVKMRIGGKSNKNIKNILLKMKEDARALKKNKIGGRFTVLLKNMIKIPQLFKK